LDEEREGKRFGSPEDSDSSRWEPLRPTKRERQNAFGEAEERRKHNWGDASSNNPLP